MRLEETPRPAAKSSGNGSTVKTSKGVSLWQSQVDVFYKDRLNCRRLPAEQGEYSVDDSFGGRRPVFEQSIISFDPKVPADVGRQVVRKEAI
jgi:hypothetical protein